MTGIIELIATFLYYISEPIFRLSLYLHQRFSTPFWKRVEAGVEQAEDRLEEMRQFMYLAEGRDDEGKEE